MQNTRYVVYGMYSNADYRAQWLDDFETEDDAKTCVAEFMEVNGRYAWIEKEEQ